MEKLDIVLEDFDGDKFKVSLSCGDFGEMVQNGSVGAVDIDVIKERLLHQLSSDEIDWDRFLATAINAKVNADKSLDITTKKIEGVTAQGYAEGVIKLVEDADPYEDDWSYDILFVNDSIPTEERGYIRAKVEDIHNTIWKEGVQKDEILHYLKNIWHKQLKQAVNNV